MSKSNKKRKLEGAFISIDEEFVWKIEDFQKKLETLNASYGPNPLVLSSRPFLMGIDVNKPSEWELQLGVKRDNKDAERFLTLSLKLLKNFSKKAQGQGVMQKIFNLVQSDIPAIRVSAKFTLVSVDENHLTRGPPANCTEFSEGESTSSYGYMKFISIQQIWRIRNELWPNDVCEIKLNAKVFGDVPAEKSKKVPALFKTLAEEVKADFLKLLDTKEGSDFTIKVENGEFAVHKAILIARAPFFKLLFKPDVDVNFGANVGQRDGNTFTVTAEEIKQTTFNRIIEYIYTGEVECGDQVDFGVFKDLVIGAEAFGLDKLKYSLMEYKLKQESLKLHEFPEIFNFIINHGPNSDISDQLLTYTAMNRKYLTLFPEFGTGFHGGMMSLFGEPRGFLPNEHLPALQNPNAQLDAGELQVNPPFELPAVQQRLEDPPIDAREEIQVINNPFN